jgi:hypothetical protein
MPVPYLNSPGLYVILPATIFDPSKESTQPKTIIKNVITPIGKDIRLHTLNMDNTIRMTGATNINIKGSILFLDYVLLNTARYDKVTHCKPLNSVKVLVCNRLSTNFIFDDLLFLFHVF